METLIELENIDVVVNNLRMYIISVCTYYLSIKITNNMSNSKTSKIVLSLIILVIAIICGNIRWLSNNINAMIALTFLLSIIFAVNTKNNIGYSLCCMVISLSISYILYFIAACIGYIPGIILRINNINDNYIDFIILTIVYIIVIYLFLKIKKFKNGFGFLQKKSKDSYFDFIILNVSIITLFLVTIVSSNYIKYVIENFGVLFIIFSIIMFITIQKSLKLYYKQKMLIKDLTETKEELKSKKREIAELEKENLNFSKVSHSIAHKQKALEFKLNNLMLESETAEEMDLKDRLESITKDLKQKTAIKLTKTEIVEIDDMLEYMQSECIKNKIDFQLQLNGNIYHMVNNYIDKEKLEILLADLIKNAIIAINYSENTNKSILVRLGIIEGVYSLYVYDSGIEFELETLANLGIKPSTTHADNGGTGMGMMNTFDTLKQYKASLIIQEYGKPCKDNFTKLIKIVFDKKNEFKVISYRQEKIEK